MSPKKKVSEVSIEDSDQTNNDASELNSGGWISAEDVAAIIQASAEAEYEAGREAREAFIAKKKVAFEELITLGVSIESARFMSNYYEED